MKESFLKAVNNQEQYYVSDIIYAGAMTERTLVKTLVQTPVSACAISY